MITCPVCQSSVHPHFEAVGVLNHARPVMSDQVRCACGRLRYRRTREETWDFPNGWYFRDLWVGPDGRMHRRFMDRRLPDGKTLSGWDLVQDEDRASVLEASIREGQVEEVLRS